MPADQKGFNSATTAPNACKFFFEFWADEYYTGDNGGINANKNMMHLKFYNNRWSSSDSLHFHMSGFVEPDKSTSGATFSGVQALSSGSITFTWPSFTGINAVWGPKVGYRVYKATSASALNNLYSITCPSATCTELAPTTHTYTFSGLTAGKYYYFKVAAARQKNAKVYTSLSTTLGQLTTVVPPVGSVFTSTIGANGSLVDKALTPGMGYKSAAISLCASKKYTLNNGGTVYKTKALINTTVWNFIMSDADQTNYSNYSSYVPPATPHWLSDASLGAGALAAIFTPYGFNTTELDKVVPYGPPPATPLIYHKTCTNSSCENLDKMVGGDDIDLPYNSVFYVGGSISNGSYRCYAPL